MTNQEKIYEHISGLFKSPPKRVLMLTPPGVDKNDFRLELVLSKRYWAYPPYGTGVLCRQLKQAGYEVELLDMNYVMLNSAHFYGKDYQYDWWKLVLYDKIFAFQPDLIGISCMYTMHDSCLKMLATESKAMWPDIPVMAGGVHVTADRSQVLRECPAIDFVGVYECDSSFPALLDVLNGKLPMQYVSQVAAIVDGEEIVLDQRQTLPQAADMVAPDYGSMPIERYDELGQVGVYGFMRQGRRAAVMLAERGCRAKCSFCSVRIFNGPKVRRREALAVADEIANLSTRYGIKHITWLDDDLLFNEERSVELFEEIASRKLDLTWDATNGLIAAAISPRLLDSMVASGCIGFNLGLESGSPEILREIHKPGTVDAYFKCKDVVAVYPHLFVKGFLIIGFPHETFRMILRTVEMAVNLGFDWYPMQTLNPMPSTEIFKSMAEEGLISSVHREGRGWKAAIFSSLNQKTREEMEKAQAQGYVDLFNAVPDLDAVPSKEELDDLWFVVDYRINYELIFRMTDPVKLEKKRLVLRDIADRITQNNPLANYFLSEVEMRLGDAPEAVRRATLYKKYLDQSAYWQTRFEALGL